ncbi:MAG: DUF4296 domain-containing protein [Ferruginibacter sp.]
MIFGCKQQSDAPPNLLPKEKMEAILWDIIQADAFTEQFVKRDSSKNAAAENVKLQQQIFLLHQVSKDNFYTSYTYYVARPDEIKIILDSIAAKSERDRMPMVRFDEEGKIDRALSK